MPTASRPASNRSLDRPSPSIKARCTPLSSGWSSGAGSRAPGRGPRPIAKPGTTASQGPAGAPCTSRPSVGAAWPVWSRSSSSTNPEPGERTMSALRRFLLRLHNFLRPARTEPDLAREVASHLGLLEDEFVRRGMTPEEARLAAKRAFGGVEQTKELHRDARSFV